MADEYESSTATKWECPKCTFLNPKLNKSCIMCEYQNVHLTKATPTATSSSKKRQDNTTDNSVGNDGYVRYKNAFITKLNSLGSDVKNFINSLDPDFSAAAASSTAATTSSSATSRHRTNQHGSGSRAKEDSSSSSAAGSTKLWRCPKCTYAANPDWARACDMCSYKRAHNENIPPRNNNNERMDQENGDEDDDDEDIKIYDTTLDKNVYDYARIWTCKRCTYINFGKDKRCELCSTSRSAGKHRPSPHHGNRTNGEKTSREEASDEPQSSSLDDKWLCPKCTYFNDATSSKCISCNASRRGDGQSTRMKKKQQQQDEEERSKTTSRGGKDWTCEICSHKNKASVKICELCANNVENLLDEQTGATTAAEAAVDDNDDNDVAIGSMHNRSISIDSDYFNATMNPSLTYRSQKAMSTLKTYTNATNQAEKIWKNIIKYCKEHNHKFVDDSFPPCDKSLFIDVNNKPANLVMRGGIQWLSPEHIRSHPHESSSLKWTVYNSPKFNDIKQGLLGNCWLLSGLAVILEQPELLAKIIITKEYCPQGCYLVRLCHNGEWQTVLLDDLFPCDCNGYLLYSQASRKQLWVPLIEKAMAKLNGSYESLIAGQTVEGLSALTGYPCDSIRLEKLTDDEEDIDLEMVWVRLLSMKEAGYALGASCGKTNIEDDASFTAHGLLPRHAYSILDVREVAGNQLVQLRNPWGRYTWTGDWSEGSPKWTPQIRKALNLKPSTSTAASTTTTTMTTTRQQTSSRQEDNHYYNRTGSNSDEGVFWISFYDFVKYFCSIDICKARLDWFESRMSGYFSAEGTREMQAYHLIVFETSEINIGLFHKTVKNRRENSDLDLCFAVLKASSSSSSAAVGKLVASSKRSIRKFIGLEHIFEPGEYLIVPFSFNFWYTSSSATRPGSSTDNNLYNLVFHSPKTFFIEQEMHSALLLADTIIQLCLTLGTRTYSGIDKACIYTLAKGHSGLIVVGENYNERSYLHIELNCENSSNVVSTRQALLTKDSVPPLHRQCLLLLTQLEGSSSYSIQYSIKYRLSSNPYLNTWPGSEGAYFTNSPEITKKTFGLHAPRSVFL